MYKSIWINDVEGDFTKSCTATQKNQKSQKTIVGWFEEWEDKEIEASGEMGLQNIICRVVTWGCGWKDSFMLVNNQVHLNVDERGA